MRRPGCSGTCDEGGCLEDGRAKAVCLVGLTSHTSVAVWRALCVRMYGVVVVVGHC